MSFALKEVFGTAGSIDSYNFAGKTDLRIIRDLLEEAGIPAKSIEENLPEVYRFMAERGQAIFSADGVIACSGVVDLLDRLYQERDLILGLLTGNIEKTARLKLHAAGIDPERFSLGAYGSDAADRNKLPEVAWRRALELTGYRFAGHDTVIIGDTPADVICAQFVQAKSVAVASGPFPAHELVKYQPDILLNDLTETDKTVEMIRHLATAS